MPNPRVTMPNYHKIFLDSSYKAPPFQPAKPFFALFNASNYWLQAAIVIAVFLVLNMMPFMREAAQNAGGTSCPSLITLFKDAFVCKEKVHDIINQTPKGYNVKPAEGEEESSAEESSDDDSDSDSSPKQTIIKRHKIIRQATTPPCPIDPTPPPVEQRCKPTHTGNACSGSTLPPQRLRCACTGSRNNNNDNWVPVRRHTRQTVHQGDVVVRAYQRKSPTRHL